ncbi:type IV secretion system protein TraC, partial [Klebsiella pneumoniae]
GKEMKVDDIAERCLEEENDQRLKDIGQQLYAFTSKGSYGKYFSRKNNVSFQNQFTVLELDELQGRKHLRQVVLLQLIYQIQQEVFLGERNRKKVVIVDEAWDLLKEGE